MLAELLYSSIPHLKVQFLSSCCVGYNNPIFLLIHTFKCKEPIETKVHLQFVAAAGERPTQKKVIISRGFFWLKSHFLAREVLEDSKGEGKKKKNQKKNKP